MFVVAAAAAAAVSMQQQQQTPWHEEEREKEKMGFEEKMKRKKIGRKTGEKTNCSLKPVKRDHPFIRVHLLNTAEKNRPLPNEGRNLSTSCLLFIPLT